MITKLIGRKLGLKVNAAKTHVCWPNKLKYPGFCVCKSPQAKLWVVRRTYVVRAISKDISYAEAL